MDPGAPLSDIFIVPTMNVIQDLLIKYDSHKYQWSKF